MNESASSQEKPTPVAGNTSLLVISWLWVGVPLLLGVLETLRTSMALFR